MAAFQYAPIQYVFVHCSAWFEQFFLKNIPLIALEADKYYLKGKRRFLLGLRATSEQKKFEKYKILHRLQIQNQNMANKVLTK